ncbi:MAG: signal peptidase I [Candidatus Mycalebacterium zealandia]|nr:MAG: signal peptidase I [Candidatus Mycalebacterium zealandia]
MFGFFGSGSGTPKSVLRQNLESVFLAIFLALCVRAFIVQPFKIPSSSMEPTLLVGDYIIVKKFAYGTRIPFTDKTVFQGSEIKKGDIVVFKKPQGPSKTKKTYFIKRVVATGNDVVRIQGRNIYINQLRIPQSYVGRYDVAPMEEYIQKFGDKDITVIYEKQRYSTHKGDIIYPFTVPAGHVFLMGDNRDNSRDSRFWGTIAEKDIVGKAVTVHWSWKFQNSFIPEIRWERIFSEIE